MLNEDLAKIIQQINALQRDREVSVNRAADFNDKSDNWKKAAEAEANKIHEIDLKVDQLQLEMRKVLNGIQSEVAVSLPEVGTSEDIGRPE